MSFEHSDRRDWRPLLAALVKGTCSEADIRDALATLAPDPLVRVYAFRGDLLRALMEVPNAVWGRHPALYEQYREAVRAGAIARRDLPVERREEFWSELGLGKT
ncbi:MAG TPA: hypothetical protein VJS39_05190 [Gemmatimonadaceae bacterium]|nr:hypothetical protein [Gemmatimonadaceae bacterium]